MTQHIEPSSVLDNGGNLIRMTFGNGAYVKYSYDLLDRPVKEVYYTSSNTITKQIRYVDNITQGTVLCVARNSSVFFGNDEYFGVLG